MPSTERPASATASASSTGPSRTGTCGAAPSPGRPGPPARGLDGDGFAVGGLAGRLIAASRRDKGRGEGRGNERYKGPGAESGAGS
ncbi:hypothetical protein MOX02_41590 [Methylobacterium oxalidis]|uniref:Uncharacterized protein n=1 Tax=Methylobacterium oxalidis TaxID=944322 RepID=A0A512J830_9HYPH|nr:hypothetical protein MOX02_41590 [Methylobacterium oxalidis]GLS67536.1 hypothetical protein GCM10007888_59200 [Methylobacterium oxalidis]